MKKEIGLVRIIEKNLVFIIVSVSIVTFITIVYSLTATRYYESNISIYRINENTNYNNMGGFANIASSFGVDIGNDEGFNFHIPDIVESRLLKENIISRKWYVEESSDSMSMIDFWKINSDRGLLNIMFNLGKKEYIAIDTSTIKMDKAIIRLNELVGVQEDESGLFTVNVTLEEPQLSKDVANYIALYIKIYISDNMNERSFKNKEFINERLANAKYELNTSENILMKFQESHFLTSENPKIQLERARLLRNVEVNQQVYITLRQQLELAEINYLKEKPIVNILDHANIMPNAVSPQPLKIISAGILLSLILSIYYKYIKHRFFA